MPKIGEFIRIERSIRQYVREYEFRKIAYLNIVRRGRQRERGEDLDEARHRIGFPFSMRRPPKLISNLVAYGQTTQVHAFRLHETNRLLSPRTPRLRDVKQDVEVQQKEG